MAIRSNLRGSEIDGEVQKQKEIMYEKIIRSCMYAGEKFVIAAREQMQDHQMGTYIDDTTNLRNSIGYFVFVDGQPLFNQGTMTPKAMTMVRQNLDKVQERAKMGKIQLILIAGMNYASYVESKGYNVISYQADLCMVDLALFLKDIGIVRDVAAANIEETFIPEELPEKFIIR